LLDLNTTITNELNSRSTRGIFLIKLFYGDETNFTGVSTVDFTDGSDFYKGVVSSMGDISYDLDFFGFKAKQNGITLKIINAKAFDDNKRFSDLVGTNAYDNRKCEIYVIPNELSGLITKEIVSYGKISANWDYDNRFVNIRISDFRTGINVALPQTVIKEDDTSNDFHYAPEDNFNKPIPILYGDHSHNTAFDSGVLTEETERWATRSKVPAIVVNEFDTSSNKAIAKCDTQAVHTLNASTVYIYNNGMYSALETASSAVAVDAATAKISYEGTTAYAMIGLNMDSAVDSSFTRDRFENTSVTKSHSYSGDGEYKDLITFGVPQMTNLGTIDTIKVYSTATASGSTSLTARWLIDGVAATTGSAIIVGQRGIVNSSDIDITADYSAPQKAAWDLESELTVESQLASSSGSLVFDQAWLQIKYAVNDPTVHKNWYDVVVPSGMFLGGENPEEMEGHEVHPTELVFLTPNNVKIVYISGKGRKYGSWVDGSRGSPGNSHNSGDLIEHPVYIIEEILRTELGLGDTNINMISFDTVAAATSTYKAAFSQFNRDKAFNIIDDICKQFCFYFFFNGEGKATLVNKKLASAYDPASLSPDYSIDFNDCDLGIIKKTDMNKVKTKVRIEYDFDYGSSNNRLNIETSSPNNTDFNRDKSMDLVIDCNKIRYDVEQSNDTNAKALATTVHDLYKDNHQTRKNVMSITALNPIYLKCEIGDIVGLSNVPSDITLFGTAFSNQNFMITKISKSESVIKMDLTQVS
jgi:hypothetical protein